MTTLGDWELMFSFWFSLPMRAVSSSLTILMTICAGEALEHIRARGALGHFAHKVLDDLEVHVRLEQRELDLTHGLLYIGLREPALAAQAFERLGQLVRQGFKCHGIYPFRS